VLFARKRDDRRELVDHLLRLRALISDGGVGVVFKPSVNQTPGQAPRWLAMLRAVEGAGWLGRVSFSFYRSDEAPTPDDLLYVLDDILEACYLGDVGRFCMEPSRLHIDLRGRGSGDRVSADLVTRLASGRDQRIT
jgi:hypothetical protein